MSLDVQDASVEGERAGGDDVVDGAPQGTTEERALLSHDDEHADDHGHGHGHGH
ncbi:hypothetical protein [Pseudonocardia sp. N23]|uniref:hypothetical protein n=1 Tax=Pseudonocardia sp. N23 TaxID=1987376 RepID=UPI000C031C9E|nr:hypothetical protein [Pseudonocardia sp. N23]GAY08459.1 hypothetical protein TOK_2215 [Pseudonocardia sp. N23]